MLNIKNLEASYGNIKVLWGVDIEVNEGEIVAIIGSNGAGKTTLLKAISGLLKPDNGEIYFNGKPISKLTYDQIVKAGISQIPEGRKLFQGMTVIDNLILGAYTRNNKKEINNDLDWVFSFFPVIRERRLQLAGTLSGGEQQMCAIARGLMSRPKLLLVDELSLGLAPIFVDKLLRIIEDIHKAGITLLIVEQDVQTALELAIRAYILETGSITLHDTSDQLLKNEHIKKAYLAI